MDRNSRKKNKKIATLMIGILAVGVAAFATRNDWAALAQQRDTADQAEAKRQRAEQKFADLAEQRARLETPAGQEKQARELGYRKPGEEPLSTR